MDTITVRVKVGRPDEPETVKEYAVPRESCLTVLDALDYIWRHLDPGLAFRYECRSGRCGVCAVSVDGQRCLACTTHLAEQPLLGPVEGLALIRDLVVDI